MHATVFIKSFQIFEYSYINLESQTDDENCFCWCEIRNGSAKGEIKIVICSNLGTVGGKEKAES